MESNKNNEVTNFMYYIYNKWGITEAKHLFGESLGEHIFNKYLNYMPHVLEWYAELDSESKQKLVDRANEMYNK